ncbi:hypothetical protein [Ornithinimicrobium kibberense]|uniref:hypothetical protein n=1 Tax=Ornithinimicrobium kibberense TaxID=282060 RepID=UPI0036222053
MSSGDRHARWVISWTAERIAGRASSPLVMDRSDVRASLNPSTSRYGPVPSTLVMTGRPPRRSKQPERWRRQGRDRHTRP